LNIIAWLRTPAATLIVLCAALLAQLPHAADVFRLIVGGMGWPAVLHGYAYAVALELAVLLFVVQRRDAESYLFACVSILVNLSYYALHGIQLFSVPALPAWLVSIALPAAIARYSHLLVDDATQAPAAIAQTDGADVAQNGGENAARVDSANDAPTKLDATQRRAQIAESGVTDVSAIVAQFGVSLRTAQADIAAVRSAMQVQNGGANHD
jgi:hypothetical protein